LTQLQAIDFWPTFHLGVALIRSAFWRREAIPRVSDSMMILSNVRGACPDSMVSPFGIVWTTIPAVLSIFGGRDIVMKLEQDLAQLQPAVTARD